MKRFGFFCTVLSVALPLWLNAESVSNGKAVLEWKNGVMELRAAGGKAGKVIFRPRFTNGVDIKSATASLIRQDKKAILLHGKDCSLTFMLDNRNAITRVSAPKNAAFTVETQTEAMVLADGLADDIILEPGEKALNLPPWLPLFTGLQGQGNWTLSCIPYLGRSDIRISADLKQWDFRPEPLEEYTFVIQSGEQIWKKVDVKLDNKERKPVAWRPPFQAKYRAAFPMAVDFFPVGKPKHQVWDIMEAKTDNKRSFHCAKRVYIVDKKANTGWSSGIYGTAPYPVFLPLEGELQMIYPRLPRSKRCSFDPARPVYIYTYDCGSYPKRPDTPLNFLTEEVRPVMFSRSSGSIGLGPATCLITKDIEKIYYRSEAREKRDVIHGQVARMQIFVESIRARIDQYVAWAKAMKKECLAASAGDNGAAPELRQFAEFFDCMEKVHQTAQARMATPEKVWEQSMELLKNLDNKDLDDEALENHCKEYGRAIRTIGGAQDNCVAECHYVARMLRLEALSAYMRSSNRTEKEFCRRFYRSTSSMLQNSFNHEGK